MQEGHTAGVLQTRETREKCSTRNLADREATTTRTTDSSAHPMTSSQKFAPKITVHHVLYCFANFGDGSKNRSTNLTDAVNVTEGQELLLQGAKEFMKMSRLAVLGGRRPK